jgi:MFS family permease
VSFVAVSDSATASRTHPNVTLAVLALGGLSYAILSSLVIPALPTLERELHTSETGVTWLLTGYLLAASVGTAIIGRLGDMYGKEKMLIWTLVVLSIGTLGSALSSSLAPMIASRFVQGVAGGIFPLAFGIVRDEFPHDKVAGGIGLLSAILGVGGGIGIVAAGLIVEHMDYHWLFWFPLIATLLAVFLTWRLVPESPERMPGRINWLGAGLMTVGVVCVLLAISQTAEWGWGSPKTIGLGLVGFLFLGLWVWNEARADEPLVDMKMMRIRGVWTANAAAFLLGAGLYASFILYPQFAQLPKSTGFGFGASVVVSGLYLAPATIGMAILGIWAGRISARFGSRAALIGGSAASGAALLFLSIAHDEPWQFLASAAILGIGIGLAYAALGNLIVQAVPTHQTGVASGVNTVSRLLGGALGGQISATFIAANVSGDYPTVTGFSQSFWLATVFIALCLAATLFVPRALGQAGELGDDPPPAVVPDPEHA